MYVCMGALPHTLKPGLHMIVRIIPIATVVSKHFETIQTTGAIVSFHMIISITSKARDVGSSAMSLRVSGSDNRIFARVLQTSHIDG